MLPQENTHKTSEHTYQHSRPSKPLFILSEYINTCNNCSIQDHRYKW